MKEIVVGMGELAVGFSGDCLAALGLGSCVSVALADPERKVAGLAHVMLPDSENSRIEPLPKNVLLADADENVRRSLRRMLSSAGYTITGEATMKEDALLLYRKTRPSVSMISAYLPPENWSGAVQELFRIDQQANVILLSPETNKTAILEWLSSGIQEVLTNPFTERKVLSGLDYVTQRKLLKFADRAIPILKERMIAFGAKEGNIVAKIAGGAHMFPTLKDEEVIMIGRKNVEAVKRLLEENAIRLVAEDIGENIGRTVRFDVASGTFTVSTKQGVKEL